MLETKLDIETEAERIKASSEETLQNGGEVGTVIAVFRDGTFQGVIIAREPDRNVERDAEAAFAEACMLFSYTHSDEFIVSFSAKVKHNERDEEVNAINIMFASRYGATTKVYPYEVDAEGNFVGWTEDKLDDMFNPIGISINMVSTMAHYASTHVDVEDDLPFVVRALSKRGHVIKLSNILNEKIHV